MSPIKEQLHSLGVLSRKLNEEADALNEMYEDLEDDLQRQGVGVSVWLDDFAARARGQQKALNSLGRTPTPIDPVFPGLAMTTSSDGAEGYSLGYARVRDKWRLAVRPMRTLPELNEGGDLVVEVGTPAPLLEASRGVRIEAARYLELLLEALEVEVREHLDGIRRARSIAALGHELVYRVESLDDACIVLANSAEEAKTLALHQQGVDGKSVERVELSDVEQKALAEIRRKDPKRVTFFPEELR